MAVQRAQDKTAQMQARAGAIDELMARAGAWLGQSHRWRRRIRPAGPPARQVTTPRGRPLAFTDSHGTWLQWLPATTP